MFSKSAVELKKMLDNGASKIDAAYFVIRDMILQNELEASQILVERDLGAMLGVSRTPVRSALHRLSYEGFITLHPDGSMMVSRLDLREIVELYECREALECKAAELFTRRRTKAMEDELLDCFNEHQQALRCGDNVRAYEMDNKTHFIIAAGTGNRRMQSTLNALITLSLRSLIIGSLDNRRYGDSLEQHKAVIDAIAGNEPERASECMRKHLEDVRRFFECIFGD